MIRFIFILSILIAQGACAQSYKKVADPAACKYKINKKAKSTNSISSDFTEEIFSSMFTSSKKANGKLKYKKTNKIRWEHVSPGKQIVLINGSQVKMLENGKFVKNVAANRIVKKVQSLMLQLFNGDFLNEKEFSIAYYENTANYKLILKPKSSRMSNYISKIEMVFSKKTLSLQRLVLQETETDKIVYSFSSVIFNGTISDANFTKF